MKKLYLSVLTGLTLISAPLLSPNTYAEDDLLSRADAQMKKVLGPEVEVAEADTRRG